MKDGQVSEHGAHPQLMARERDYASLFTSMQQEVSLQGGGGGPPPLALGQPFAPLPTFTKTY